MAQGDILLNDDGTIALDGAGLIRTVDASSDCPDCCGGCTDDGADCDHCDDVDPSQYKVTFSEVDWCECYKVGGTDSFEYILAEHNTVFTLSQSAGNNCVWEHTQNVLRNEYYSASNCTGTVGYSDSFDSFTVRLTRSGTQWTLTAGFDGYSLNFSTGFTFNATVNADNDGGDSLCGTISNQFNNTCSTNCDADFFDDFGENGTATVVCL